jgi:hypothetical protein
MSEEGAGPEKKQNQSNVQLLRAWYRTVGLSEDDISELMREPAADDERVTAVRARRGTTS